MFWRLSAIVFYLLESVVNWINKEMDESILKLHPNHVNRHFPFRPWDPRFVFACHPATPRWPSEASAGDVGHLHLGYCTSPSAPLHNIHSMHMFMSGISRSEFDYSLSPECIPVLQLINKLNLRNVLKSLTRCWTHENTSSMVSFFCTFFKCLVY